MKKYGFPLLTLILAVACAALLFLWQAERNSTRQLDELWLSSMTAAHQRFSEYLDTGSEGDYWYGAAEFQTMTACAAAADRRGKTDANAVCGALMYDAEFAQSHLNELCQTLSRCISDPENEAQWELSMNELRHLLEH